MHVENFLDRLNSIENFFDYAEIADTKKMKLVAYKLPGGASA